MALQEVPLETRQQRPGNWAAMRWLLLWRVHPEKTTLWKETVPRSSQLAPPSHLTAALRESAWNKEWSPPSFGSQLLPPPRFFFFLIKKAWKILSAGDGATAQRNESPEQKKDILHTERSPVRLIQRIQSYSFLITSDKWRSKCSLEKQMFS